VLIDRRGMVAMYHPGVLSYDELRAEIEKVMAPAAAAHRNSPPHTGKAPR
jgi:hypothetical protein